MTLLYRRALSQTRKKKSERKKKPKKLISHFVIKIDNEEEGDSKRIVVSTRNGSNHSVYDNEKLGEYAAIR
jgi:hypothetical protein